MFSRRMIVLAALGSVMLAACNDGPRIIGLGGSNGVAVRFVNATDAALDLTANGQVIGGNGHIPPGTSTACLQLDPTSVNAGIRPSGSTSDLPGFAPAFAVGGAYTVIVFPGSTGVTQVVTMSDAFTPTSGLSGLRIFDAAPATGPLDIFVTPPGASLSVPSAASIGFGGNTGFFAVSPGTSQVRFTIATTSTLAFDAGDIVLVAGQSSTLVLAPPAAGSSKPAALLLPTC